MVPIVTVDTNLDWTLKISSLVKSLHIQKKKMTVRVNGQSYKEMLSHRSMLALTNKSDTLHPKRTVAGLGEAHWIILIHLHHKMQKNAINMLVTFSR